MGRHNATEEVPLIPVTWWAGAAIRHPKHHSGVLKSFDLYSDQAIIRCDISCRHEHVRLTELTLCPIMVKLHHESIEIQK